MTTLANQWRAAGIERGDVVLLHSSSKRTLKTHGITPTELLESFLDAAGPTGTLLLPTFNFGWCHGKPFTVRTTPSEMGVLSETGRQMISRRSGNPVYSFVAWGGGLGYIGMRDNWSAYGPGSPFDCLRKIDGKIAVLDLPDQNSMTMYHAVEEMVAEYSDLPHAVWYSKQYPSHRFYKNFDGRYTGYDGRECERTFALYVRRDGVETFVDPMGELLWERGHYKGDRPHVGAGLRTIRARAVWDETAAVIRAGKAEGMLWRRAA